MPARADRVASHPWWCGRDGPAAAGLEADDDGVVARAGGPAFSASVHVWSRTAMSSKSIVVATGQLDSRLAAVWTTVEYRAYTVGTLYMVTQ
jgi:hypothetical protein